MPESVQIILSLGIILTVSILTIMGTRWWTRRVCLTIIKELEEKGAINAATAVSLPYDKSPLLQIGYRDYRPKALESLVMGEVVVRTFNGQYYLDKEKLAENQTAPAQ